MNWYNKLTDKFGFAIPLVVQGGMVTVSMIALSTGPLTAVGYVSLGIAAVIFAPRAFEKGIYEKSYTRKSIYFVNYALLAFYSIFIGISFSLAGTLKLNEISGINITVDNDPVLQDIEDRLSVALNVLEGQKAEFGQSSRESTVGSAQGGMRGSESDLRKIQNEKKERLDEIESGKATQQARRNAAKLSADDIFQAIPNAWSSGRRIQVLFWMCLIFGIELMIINALATATPAGPTRRKREPKPAQLTGKQISAWLDVEFYGFENGKTTKILPKSTFAEFKNRRKEQFNPKLFDTLVSRARECGVIDEYDKILVTDKSRAAALIAGKS